jgi:hypothetical protein
VFTVTRSKPRDLFAVGVFENQFDAGTVETRWEQWRRMKQYAIGMSKGAHSRSITLGKNVLCNTSLPIYDQSCCAKMFCVTQVSTKYDSIHVATWLHNFSRVLRAIVFVSHILSMTSETCIAIISALECSPEKAKKRCFHINDWIPIDTCCATSPLTMQTNRARALLHKKISEQF